MAGKNTGTKGFGKKIIRAFRKRKSGQTYTEYLKMKGDL